MKDIRVPTHTIVVNEPIIEKACQRDSHHCMIAEAIRDQIPGATLITVDLMTIRFSIPEKGLRFNYNTPNIAADALARFDRGIAVDPFTVRLKNGHATSMKKEGKNIHNFGAKELTVSRSPSGGGGTRTEIVGGNAKPVQRPKHPSHSSIRTFGKRSFTEGWIHVSEKEQTSPSSTP